LVRGGAEWCRLGAAMVHPVNVACRAILAAATWTALAGATPVAIAQETLKGAVVFVYHRFGEDDVPSTNIRLDQFDAHLRELTGGEYNVLPLSEITAAMREGRALPDRTVAITIDDAYLSVYTAALPRLREAGIPFTVFVATDQLDKGGGSRYMTWSHIRELRDAGVEIGAHSAGHGHFPTMSEDEVRADLARSSAAFERELGAVPYLFAYPYGEMSLEAQELVREAGFTTAFGQHSGVAEAGLDMFYQPRFALNETYGAISRFVLAANALPLGARDIVPVDPVLVQNPPSFGFTVAEGVEPLDQLNCFASHESTPARLERLGDRRFEVRLDTAFPPGRGRFNCTVRANSERWRWFGVQFYVPRP